MYQTGLKQRIKPKSESCLKINNGYNESQMAERILTQDFKVKQGIEQAENVKIAIFLFKEQFQWAGTYQSRQATTLLSKQTIV